MRRLIVVFLILMAGYSSNLQAQKNNKAVAFSKMEFRENIPYVEYRGDWVELLKIEGIDIAKYIDYAKTNYPTDWKLPMVRYVHYIMDDWKMLVKDSINATIKYNGKEIEKKFVLKKENRNLATDYYLNSIGKNRITRKHAKVETNKYDYLNTRLDGYKQLEEGWLSKEEAVHDLEHLEWQIENNYSYKDLRGFDYKTAIDVMVTDLREGISNRDIAMQLKMFMANFGDGHSRVSAKYILKKEDKKRLPFVITKDQGKYYAVSPKNNDFFNKEYPLIESINGQDVDVLFRIARRFVSKTTPKNIEADALRYLNIIPFILKLAGENNIEKVNVKFSNGNKTYEHKYKLDDYKNGYALKRYYLHDEMLDGNIGYLAFNYHMDSRKKFIASLHERMQKYKNTNGLVIDIRGNGGGSRKPLLAVLPYLIKKPVIVNVARYRIDADKDLHPKDGYLIDRYSYLEDYSGYTKEEKNVIDSFKKEFTPSRLVASYKYTYYHYMVVSPTKKNNTYYYDKPVIVLVDEGCFSASDIFAAGIRMGDNVKLLGNTTGGGSGFSKGRRLPNSKIKVKLSRMFSYQPDGNMYDGHGVEPDYRIDYTLEDKLGKTDSQLKAAVSILSK